MDQSRFIRALLSEGYDGDYPQRSVFAGLLGSADASNAGVPQSLPQIDVGSSVAPGDEAHDFIQRQLQSGEPQLPQRDTKGEMQAYKTVTQYMPGAAVAKAFGALPDFNGGAQPGVAQELYNGDYRGALSDLFGVALGYGVGRFVRPMIFPKGGKGQVNNQKK